MGDSSFLLIIVFICLMTGLFPPGYGLKKKIRFKKIKPIFINGIIIAVIIGTGFSSFLKRASSEFFERSEQVSAFVVFDQETHEKVATYQIAPSNFSNHIQLQLHSRTVLDDDSILLEISLTNTMDQPFEFNTNSLSIITETGENIAPTSVVINGDPENSIFKIQAGETIQGKFTYLKSIDETSFQLKYFPFEV